ncbi:MAG: class I mannose-6-phosphate isomerase, partial [Butyrivibrio sp.]|nr:class I mannose-6-phosphate isomerase [Butyrivibrio sp.]
MNLPFLLSPASKDYLWGGSRLNDEFHKNIDMYPLAETWECSTHPDGQSRKADTGELLGDVLKDHPEYLGTHSLSLTGGKAELPILIKLIDAKS